MVSWSSPDPVDIGCSLGNKVDVDLDRDFFIEPNIFGQDFLIEKPGHILCVQANSYNELDEARHGCERQQVHGAHSEGEG